MKADLYIVLKGYRDRLETRLQSLESAVRDASGGERTVLAALNRAMGETLELANLITFANDNGLRDLDVAKVIFKDLKKRVSGTKSGLDSPFKIVALVRDYRDGAHQDELRKKYKTGTATICKILRAMGVEIRGVGGSKWPPFDERLSKLEIDDIVKMRRNGAGVAKIATVTHHNTRTVHKILRKFAPELAGTLTVGKRVEMAKIEARKELLRELAAKPEPPKKPSGPKVKVARRKANLDELED